MPKTSPKCVKGRYDLAEITDRIEELRKRRGATAKAIGAVVGISAPQWSHKVSRDTSTFSIEEIGDRRRPRRSAGLALPR